MPSERTKARFFEPMLLLATNSLPESQDWVYELKLDGYRAIAFKSNGRVHLRSRNNKDFAVRYPAITSALQNLPNETVIDGEVVALDDSGRPSFNTLQNFGSSTVPLFYYAFDVLILGGRDVRFQALETRRELLMTKVLSRLHEPIRYSPDLDATVPDLIRSVREQGFRRAGCETSRQRLRIWPA
jgi:ATP-dependent DNA ligase